MMREYIVKFETDTPLSEITAGSMVRAAIKTVGDCDEVIRCKDCKRFYANDGTASQCRYSGNKEGYCFMAERKEDK